MSENTRILLHGRLSVQLQQSDSGRDTGFSGRPRWPSQVQYSTGWQAAVQAAAGMLEIQQTRAVSSWRLKDCERSTITAGESNSLKPDGDLSMMAERKERE